MSRDEVVPDRRHRDRVAVLAGREARLVPVRERAHVLVRREVLTEPSLLRGAGVATADGRLTRPIAAFRVEGDQMPLGDVVAVPALAERAGRDAEVVEVGRRIVDVARSSVFVVARNRMGDRAQPSPAQCVRLGERVRAAAFVLVVAERQDSGEVVDRQEQVARRHFLAAGGVPCAEAGIGRIAGDVAGCCDQCGCAADELSLFRFARRPGRRRGRSAARAEAAQRLASSLSRAAPERGDSRRRVRRT